MPLPQRRKHRIAISCFFFLAGICFFSWASRIPDIQTRLHLSNAALGGVLLCLPVGLLISLPVAGFLVAKYGSRIIVITAAVLYAVTLPLLGFANSSAALMVTLFFFGLGGNMLNISMNTQAVGTETFYEKPVMASFHGIWSMGGFTGGALGTLMVRYQIMPVFHFLCVTGIAFLILIIFGGSLIPKDINQNKQHPIFARPDRSILNFGMIAFCAMICEGAMSDWSGVYFAKIVRPDPKWITIGFTAYVSTMATGRFVGDWVSYKIGMKRMLQLSGLLTATGLLLAVFFPEFITATIGFLIVGAGVSSVIPLIYSTVGNSKLNVPGCSNSSCFHNWLSWIPYRSTGYCFIAQALRV